MASTLRRLSRAVVAGDAGSRARRDSSVRQSSTETPSAGSRRLEGAAVVDEHLAEADERVVDLGHAGLLGLLVAADGPDDVAAERGRRHGDAGQADLGETRGDQGKPSSGAPNVTGAGP